MEIDRRRFLKAGTLALAAGVLTSTSPLSDHVDALTAHRPVTSRAHSG